MGCGSSTATSTVAPDQQDLAGELKPAAKNVYPPAEAFVVPLDDDAPMSAEDLATDGSIIKRHPPKRVLQRLAEPSANQQPVTIEDLEEKLANADLRRNKFLQERVDRIKEAEDTESTEGAEINNNSSGSSKGSKSSKRRNYHRNIEQQPMELTDVDDVRKRLADESEPEIMKAIDGVDVVK